MVGEDDSRLPVPRQWPAGEELDPTTAITIDCPGCGSPWRVHPDLAGFRLRCACGTWIRMPPRIQTAAAAALPFADASVPATVERSLDAQGRIELALRSGEVAEGDIPVHLPMAPGTLQQANVATRQRWTNAVIIELAGVMAAFLLPATAAYMLLDGEARALALPFTSMVTGIMIVVFAALRSEHVFTGLRAAKTRYFAEATLGAAILAALALLWVSVLTEHLDAENELRGLREALGIGWTLFTIALCPALFEELAFRGVVQARACALLGRFQGLIATGAAFGLCHGVTAALPFHVGIGVWLCFLRERSASLLPCMLAHGLYNALIVLLS